MVQRPAVTGIVAMVHPHDGLDIVNDFILAQADVILFNIFRVFVIVVREVLP